MVALWTSLWALFAGASPVSAHAATDGSTTITVDDARVVVTAEVRFTELGYVDTSGDGLIDGDELADQEADIAPTIVATARDHVTVSVDGEAAEIVGAGVPAPSAVVSDGEGASMFATLVVATGPHDGDVTEVDVELTFHTASSHVALTDADGTVHGELDDDAMVKFSLDGWSSATSFFSSGIEQVVFGLDHLLFLIVLTIAVVGTTVDRMTTRRVVKLSAALVLGHAVGLGLTYFELVSVPAWVVGPTSWVLIAAVAVSTICGRMAAVRPWIAAIITLIHGLGFASDLGSVGVATSQRFVALASFDAGLGIAETASVLLVTGALWLCGLVLDRWRRRSQVQVLSATTASASRERARV